MHELEFQGGTEPAPRLAFGQRSWERHDIYADDGFHINLIKADGSLLTEFLVYNLSGFGVLLASDKDLKLAEGDEVFHINVSLNHLSLGTIDFGSVRHSFKRGQRFHWGITFHIAARNDGIQRRALERFVIHETLQTSLSCTHPINFVDRLVFTVLNATKDGLRLATSLRNRLILPGMVFKNARLNAPSWGEATIDFVIEWYQLHQDLDQVIIGAALKKRDHNYLHLISQLCLASTREPLATRLKNIVAAGLKPKRLKALLRYEYPKNPHELRDVAFVRWRAYSEAGKVDSDLRPEDMMDEFDKRSRIILARLAGEVVGSVRLTFCNQSQDSFELEHVTKLPKRYNRMNTLEISRMCVLPELQGTDLVHGLMEQAAQVFFKTGKKFLITSCTERLLKFYRRIGYREVGQSFVIPHLGSEPHFLIEINPEQGAAAWRVNPIYWFYTWADTQRYLQKSGYLKLGFFAKLRVEAFHLLGKGAALLLKLKINKRQHTPRADGA